jgi:hypothetical protein
MKYLKKYPWINKKFIFYTVVTILFIILLYFMNHKDTNPPIITSNKKIALCFLIYDKINHEQIWYDYLKNIDPNKYNIYIHYKENAPLKYFEKYKLQNCIETCWGCLSLVLAQNLILKEALKDPLNQHFVWLSGACIPIKSFNYVYEYLDERKSYFNLSPDSQIFPRANYALNYMERKNIKKASMASIINRKHAELFVNNDDNIKQWFEGVGVPDEHVYISLLYHYNLENELILTNNLAAGGIIFSQWGDNEMFKDSILVKQTPNEYKYICPEELEYLINSESLFARKFTPECKGLDNLNNILNGI